MAAALVLALSCLLQSCSKTQENVPAGDGYGYVQFKLYKEASYPGSRATVPELDYLADAAKVMVMLRSGDSQITQTLTLSASSEEAAEYGLRSRKLKLLTGEYSVVAFTLYDKMDEELYKGGEAGSFEVVQGGMAVHDLLAKVTPRGKAQFTLVKDFGTRVKAAAREYTFDEIAFVDISIKEKNTGVMTSFSALPAKFSLHFDESDDVEDGYRTSSLVCDTLVSLRAGDYVFDSYTVYDKSRKLLERNSRATAAEFSVSDNALTKANLPVRLYLSDEYIRDYYALKEIWESLDGPNWYYGGEEYPKGTNWNFNKDPDLWGDQPGVQLHSNGRVALINISDFGFRGDMSPALGQLTELVELYLGSHSDKNATEYDPTMEKMASSATRMERYKAHMDLMHPVTPFSEPVARALKENGIELPQTRLYDRYSEDELIERGTGRAKNGISLKDNIHGKLYNGLKSLPEEIGKLKKLEKLFVGNGEISTLPDALADLPSLLEVEFYNCSKMTRIPEVLGRLQGIEVLNFGNNLQLPPEEINRLLPMLADSPAAATLQILYLNANNMTVLDGEAVSKIPKIGLLDLSSNKIETITAPFGPEIAPAKLFLDHNRISSFPTVDGLFCNTEYIESFSVQDNLLTQVPDIFTAKTKYVMGTVDFSFNHISGFENAGNGYKGLNASTLTLNNNPELTVYPTCLAESGSMISYISMRGCSLEEIPEGSFVGENVKYLTTLDLSYNHLTDLPAEMHAVNIPYFYGVDLSYNRFSSFPWEPLDSFRLTVFAIRGQRSASGARCLSEWPAGIGDHRGLRALYIGSNNIGMVSDKISSLIYFLDISDNPEIVFDASDICSAYAAGRYILIYDKTQEIRGCSYINLD